MNQFEPVRYQIKIEGASLGVREADEIGQAVAPLLGVENSLLVLDLSDVKRIDWYGLHAIATVADRARPKVEIVVRAIVSSVDSFGLGVKAVRSSLAGASG